MKCLLVFASLIACGMASIYHSHLFAAPAVAVPAAVPVATAWSATVPQSRFTRTDWIQPGVQYTVPAVAKYQSITPGFTSYHPAVAPVVAHAPLVAHAHAPLLAPAAPIFGAHLIKK